MKPLAGPETKAITDALSPDEARTFLELVRIVDFGLSGVLPQSAVPAPRAPGRGGRSQDAAR